MAQDLARMGTIDIAFKQLGRTRVLRAQELANRFGRKKLPGTLILALGLRETWLRNILGGAKQVNGKWVGLDSETEWMIMDAGVLQISKRYHGDALREMPAAHAGTWAVVEGANAYEKGMVPTFKAAVPFVLREMADSLDFAREQGVPERDRQRFAVAAHNAGKGGAWTGYKAGNVDSHTAGGDYSAWVLDAHKKIEQWLKEHPKWKL